MTVYFPQDRAIWFIADPESGLQSKFTLTDLPAPANTATAVCQPLKKL
jgi:hypothetical protein